ncbi:MAG: hypothetical protein EZS28_003008 [Streblomastix strix]|uniref:DDE-1 domain-containing protein n=1 Tax=Streblomastix strix TaxID=222440 RepID=A0A5J4X2P0_9EUKA|nr:MAG: hypothetical protein EZS28_003008 [Streblomastix strix]
MRRKLKFTISKVKRLKANMDIIQEASPKLKSLKIKYNYGATDTSIIGVGVIRRKSLQGTMQRHNNNQNIIGKGRFLKLGADFELDVQEAVRRELSFKHRIKPAVILKLAKQLINSSKYNDRSKQFKRNRGKDVDSKRYHASTKSNIRHWVQLVQKLINDLEIPVQLILNLDESGILSFRNESKPLLIQLAYNEQKYNIQPTQHMIITFLMTAAVDGESQNPALWRASQKANIDVITFQSQTTHICQPYDCGVFRTFKKATQVFPRLHILIHQATLSETSNRQPILSPDPKKHVEVNIYSGEQIQYTNKIDQNGKFQNLMNGTVNIFQNSSNEDETTSLCMDVLNILPLEDQKKVKGGSRPQNDQQPFSLPRYRGDQLNRITTESTLIEAAISVVEQENWKKNFWMILLTKHKIQEKTTKQKVDETQSQKTLKKLEKAQKQLSINTTLLQQLGVIQQTSTIVWLDQPFMTARDGPDQSNTKLRSRQPTSRRQWIVPLKQMKPKSYTLTYPNQNQSQILNVDIRGMIINTFPVPKGIQHQQIAGDAAQVYHAPRETFLTNGKVIKVIYSADRTVSTQEGVSINKSINIQIAPSTQLQRNPIREPEIENQG